ncbi:MAG: CoA-transferase [Isosphaeraceae bacterium]
MPRDAEELDQNRSDVLASVEELSAQIQNGQTIIIGGFGTVNHPMALIRQTIKNGVRDLTVIGSATAGLEVDLLIGAGCVRKVIAPYVGAEMFAPIGNCFRRAAERGEIEVWECSEYILYAGLFAAASNLGFMAWRGGVGTSIPTLNPDLVEFADPIRGEAGGKYLAVPAISGDWALIHVGRADKYGNGQHMGPYFGDRWLARAADRIVCQTEQLADNDVIRRSPFMTSMPYSDVVVEAPWGSHPYAAHGFYREDVEHLREYVEASKTFREGNDAPLKAYLDRYVFRPKDHLEYLETIGLRRLLSLRQSPIAGW